MHLDDHVNDMAKEAVNNHSKFQSFAWHDEPEDSQEWCIVYVSNRDSTLLAESNAAVIAKELEPFLEDSNMIRSERHSCWANGYRDGYAIRVFTDTTHTEVTPAFKKWCELALALEDYPVLDDSDYSRREYEATLENIESEGYNHLKENVPEDWSRKVFGWLWENNQRSLESEDDQGGCPSEEDVCKALKALGLHEEEDAAEE